MHGFKQVLTDWLLRLRPTRVMEWGPGLSTELILGHAPHASLVSVEHQESYHATAVELVQRMRAEGRAKVLLLPCVSRKSTYATVAYDHGPFDLVFVDGRRRVECVLVALTCLRPGGVVILHDACRIEYTRVLSHYCDTIEHRSNTLVLRPRFALPTPS